MIAGGLSILAKLIGGFGQLALIIAAIYVLIKVGKLLDRIPNLVK